MANISLSGQIKAEVDHIPVQTITRVSVSSNAPGTVKKGGYGVIGVAQGIEDASGSFTIVPTSVGMEIDLLALKAKVGGFAFSFNRGASRYCAIGCRITKIDDSNDPGAGNHDVVVNWIAGEIIQLA